MRVISKKDPPLVNRIPKLFVDCNNLLIPYSDYLHIFQHKHCFKYILLKMGQLYAFFLEILVTYQKPLILYKQRIKGYLHHQKMINFENVIFQAESTFFIS